MREDMAHAFMTWRDREVTQWAELAADKPNMIGRASTCAVAIGADHPSVSREQALVTLEGPRFTIRHRGKVNPTLVNGVAIDRDRATSLADRDTVALGGLHLVFHDLASGDRTSGWICGTCKRENSATSSECWFDGTSRAYADSMIGVWHPVLCRVLAERDGVSEMYDLYKEDTLVILQSRIARQGHREKLPADAIAAIEIRHDLPMLRLPATMGAVTLNDEAAADAQILKTGDELRAGGSRLFFVVREISRRTV
jgi:hypothetical protein